MNSQLVNQLEGYGRRWEQWVGEIPDFYFNLLESIFVIVVLILARFIILRILNRRVADPATLYRWRKNLAYALSFIGFLVVGRIWFEGIASLATFLGLLSAGIVIALRDPLLDMAGWIYMLWRKPFIVGDRIEIGGNRGDVIDIRLFKFTILEIGNWVHADQSTGRVIHISNHRVFMDPVANYTSGFQFIWNEIEVVLTFESNWKKAKKILNEIADEHLDDFVKDADKQVQKASATYLIRYNYLTPIVYTEVDTNRGIKLTLRHLTDPRSRRRTIMIIWEDVLGKFQKEEDIAFAYPTYRLYQRGHDTSPD